MKKYFLDLNNLTIKTSYNYITIAAERTLEAASFNADETSFAEIRELAEGLATELIAHSDSGAAVEKAFEVDINYNGKVDSKEDVENLFALFASTFCGIFLSSICLNEGRPREHRLDVPTKFAMYVSASQSALKKVINYKTKIDNFTVAVYFHAPAYESIFTYFLTHDIDEEVEHDA